MSAITAIPSATRSFESCIFDAPIEDVFRMFRPVNFKYDPSIELQEMKDADTQGAGSLRKVQYKDALQTLQVLGISDLDFKVQWNMIASEPPVSYSSAVNQVQCHRITSQFGKRGPQTMVAWQTDFSNDASANVVADSNLKKKDAFKLIKTALGNRLLASELDTEMMAFITHKSKSWEAFSGAFAKAGEMGLFKKLSIKRCVVSRGDVDDKGNVEVHIKLYFPEEMLGAVQKMVQYDAPPFVGGPDFVKNGIVIPPITKTFGTVEQRLVFE